MTTTEKAVGYSHRLREDCTPLTEAGVVGSPLGNTGTSQEAEEKGEIVGKCLYCGFRGND